MSSATAPRFWKLLAFRLTLWYGGILAVAASLCFLISHFVMVSAMRSRTDADLLHEATRCMSAVRSGNIPALTRQIENDARATGTNDIFFLVYDHNDRPIASSDLSTWGDMSLAAPSAGETGMNGTPYYQEAFGAGHHERIRVLTLAADNGNVLRVGITVQDDQRVIDQARKINSLIMLVVVAIAVVVGWLLAKRALVGVQHVTSTANAISGGALRRRVPTLGSGDEIDQLANTFNRMLERIESLVKSMEETNDNIAHELRSPITRIRGQAETTLTGHGSIETYREMAASTVDECDRLLAIINTMLDIAEAEAGVMGLKMASADVNALLRDICELYEPMTAEKSIQVLVDVPESLSIRGDVQRLQRMVAALLDNAVKYTPHGGTIRASARPADGQVEISVVNTGEGIVAEKLPRIFQRFYRADASRSGSGYGLGLSLAQAIVHAHGGRISVRSIPGHTTTFSVVLPAASDAPQSAVSNVTKL
jgi:heavy metal sensor kinase